MAERSNWRVQGTRALLLRMMQHSTQQGSSGPQPPAIAGALANSPLGPSDHTHRLRLAMAAPARIKGTCLSGRRRRRATLAAAPALAAVLLAAPCVGLVQNHALNHANHALAASRPARARPTRPCVKATATRLPSLASNVLKLKDEVLNPKPDANGWCLEGVGRKALEEMNGDRRRHGRWRPRERGRPDLRGGDREPADDGLVGGTRRASYVPLCTANLDG